MQVFICYSRADKQFAAQLVEDLSEYDLKVWMDVRNIPTGTNWDLEVQKGLDGSDVMLVLLTTSAAASQNVADEWSYFIEKNKAIIPLLVQECEVPFRLSRRQRVDFTGDYKVGLQQLLKSLGSPAQLDPESTQRIRVRPVSPPATPVPATAVKAAPVAVQPAQKPATATSPDLAARPLPVVWSESYNWFNGLGPSAAIGDAVVNPRELRLIPRNRPIITIPLRSLVSAKIQRSVDQHLKITYYGPDNNFQSLALMGAPKDRRRDITREVLNLLKLMTGRSLD